MNALLLVLALVPAPDAAGTAQPLPVVTCTAQRLRAFVGPTGVRQPWPVATGLPEHLASGFGTLLSDQGMVADGYMQILHVDASAQTAYVVQQGGLAGFRTIYGPLPVAWCSGSPRNSSFKPKPFRGSD